VGNSKSYTFTLGNIHPSYLAEKLGMDNCTDAEEISLFLDKVATARTANFFLYEYYNLLGELDARERKVVVHFFGLAGRTRLSVEEIAEIFRNPGLDSARIRDTLSIAMGKLRNAHARNNSHT